MWPLGSASVMEIEGVSFRLCNISKVDSHVEYRRKEPLDWLTSNQHRGNVRLFQEGQRIRAVTIRTECSPAGDLWSGLHGDSRDASELEVRIFRSVFKQDHS